MSCIVSLSLLRISPVIGLFVARNVRNEFLTTFQVTLRRQIQQLSFEDLREALKARKYSCVQVLHAFQEKAVEVTISH